MPEAYERKLELAAAYEQVSVSCFVINNVVATAEWIIEAPERFALPATDWQIFHEALLAPPSPNLALKQAARRYRELMSG